MSNTAEGLQTGVTFASAGVTTPNASTNYVIANAVNAMIDGDLVAHPAVTATAAPLVDANGDTFRPVAPGRSCLFLLIRNRAGTVSFKQSETMPMVNQPASGGIALTVGPFAPSQPWAGRGFAPVATILVQVGSTATAPFQFGVTQWNATGITTTVANVGFMTEAPRTA